MVDSANDEVRLVALDDESHDYSEPGAPTHFFFFFFEVSSNDKRGGCQNMLVMDI